MIGYSMAEGGIMEIRVSGKITKTEIDTVWSKIKADLPPTGKINLLEIIDDFDGIETSALWRDMKLGLPMLDRVEKAAFVSDRNWIEALSNAADVFVSAEVRTFEPQEVDQARAWLKVA